MSTLAKALENPLQTAGIIILITGAGGAFGGMIRLAGVGETIEALAKSYNISLILLAWGATAVVRMEEGMEEANLAEVMEAEAGPMEEMGVKAVVRDHSRSGKRRLGRSLRLA